MEMKEEIMQEGECSYNKLGVAIDVDDAVEHVKDVVLDVDSMVYFMEEKLASTRGKPSDRPTIFRVPDDIRNNDAAAYSPKVVSIGLLQQEKRRLDEHKWHSLDKVLSRERKTAVLPKDFDLIPEVEGVISDELPKDFDLIPEVEGVISDDITPWTLGIGPKPDPVVCPGSTVARRKNSLKMYTKEIANIVVKAASCYSPKPGGMLESRLRDYVEIMLVDGCFLINLFLQLKDRSVQSKDRSVQLEDRSVEINDPIYSNRWTLPWVGHDMLLLENQLPFFVLEKLWELTGRERPALKTKVLQFFRNLLPEEHDLELPETKDVHHLLHLIHLSLQPASSSKKPESTSGTTIPSPPQPGDTHSSTRNSSFESPESLQPTSPTMTSQPVSVPLLQGRANLMPHDPTPPGLKHTSPGLEQIPRAQQIKPESTGGTTIPNPPQPIDTLSSTKNSSFKSPKPLQPASPIEKPESTSGATIPSPPQPSDTLCTSKSSPSISIESLQPTSRARIFQSALLPHDESQSALFPHDEFPIPSCLEQILSRGLTQIPTCPPMILQSSLPLHEFPIPSGSENRCHEALTPHDLEQIQIPRAQQIKQMSERRPTPPPKTIPSATELQEAGVKLQRRRARSFLDVTFEQGLMQIPRLTISDSTNSLFRNFIAFEQGFPDCGNHFTSYCSFLDSLINTPRDVEILKQAGIIEHVLGSDKEVAFLFNKLCKGTTWDFKNSYLAKVFEDVNQHTLKSWPKWRAKLVRDYFSNPWAIISLIGAIVILFLTLLQTCFAVFAYFRPHRPSSFISALNV